MTRANRAQLVKTIGQAVGFDRVGIAPGGPLERAAYYKAWLAAGYAGTLDYLHRNVELRSDPSQLLPKARSVICVALNYCRPPPTSSGHDRPNGTVAAYARGRDYHVVLRRMLGELLDRLRAELDEPFDTRICVDTAPVLERELARAAGIGWVGKNTCILDQRQGSYLFLAEAITTLELACDEPVADHCARCTRCLDACPTDAFIAPYQLDASRCISYLTIEHRGKIPPEFHGHIGKRVFGCDVCQEVCPYNKHTPSATHPDVLADRTPELLDLLDLLKLRSAEYRRLTRDAATRRVRRPMWRRNAAVCLGNATPPSAAVLEEIQAALEEATHDEDATVRHAAVASLRRISASSR